MAGSKTRSWKTPTLASLALIGVCIAPVVGELATWVLLPMIAGLLLTIGMVLLVVEIAIGTQPVSMILLPMFYAAGLASVYIDWQTLADGATQAVAQSVEEAQDLRVYGPVRSLTLVRDHDEGEINAHYMLQTYRLDEVTQIDPETRKGYRYTIVKGDKPPKPVADGANTILHSRAKDANGNVALIKRVPASSYSPGPVIVQGETETIAGLSGSGIVPLEIRNGGQRVTLLSAWAEVPTAYPLPMIYRDPTKNGRLRFRLGFESRKTLDPDGLDAAERVVELLDLQPQDFSRFD